MSNPSTEKAMPRQVWVEFGSLTTGIVSRFMYEFGEDPLAQALVSMDHQLSTDSDLDEITGSETYRALRLRLRTAMAQKLGYASYQEEPRRDPGFQRSA